MGFSIKKQLKDDVLYKDRDSQVAAISETFELVKKPVSRLLYIIDKHIIDKPTRYVRAFIDYVITWQFSTVASQ